MATAILVCRHPEPADADATPGKELVVPGKHEWQDDHVRGVVAEGADPVVSPIRDSGAQVAEMNSIGGLYHTSRVCVTSVKYSSSLLICRGVADTVTRPAVLFSIGASAL